MCVYIYIDTHIHTSVRPSVHACMHACLRMYMYIPHHIIPHHITSHHTAAHHTIPLQTLHNYMHAWKVGIYHLVPWDPDQAADPIDHDLVHEVSRQPVCQWVLILWPSSLPKLHTNTINGWSFPAILPIYCSLPSPSGHGCGVRHWVDRSLCWGWEGEESFQQLVHFNELPSPKNNESSPIWACLFQWKTLLV